MAGKKMYGLEIKEDEVVKKALGILGKELTVEEYAMNGKHKQIFLGLCIALFLLFVTFTAVASSTIYVPDDYANIQWAVDNASVGDTVVVKSGTYYEKVNVTKQILLRGMDTGGGKPVVYGRGRRITLSADGITLEGFKVDNRFKAVDSVTNVGLHIQQPIPPGPAYGITIRSNNNIIMNNTVIGKGGLCGIDCIGNLNLIRGNDVYNYYASAGIVISGFDNIIIGNNVNNHWFGICCPSNNNKIYFNTFIGNRIYVCPTDSTNIWNSTGKITYTYNGTTYTNYLGNYWDDYEGTDANGDGIGDTPYSIDEDKDNYPLMEPFENYTALTENLLPIASFTYSPENIDIYQVITFNASSSYDIDGFITNYEWEFGDGTNGTGELITHSYPAVGDYIVNLTVTDNDGATNTSMERITVSILPDLVIIEKWLCSQDNCTICYNVTNIGNGAALVACHNTTLYVDGVAVARDHVPVDLAPGESYLGCFDDCTWTYTPPSDNITVCADNNEIVVELDETNNGVTNIWMCGDVNCDGKVTMSDVRKVFNRYLDPNYPLDLPWAADVNCNGKVTMSDVRKVFNRYLDPGYELNCRCEGVG